MAAWPTELPAPALSTFSGAFANNLLRSSMDKGPAKVRRRTTANTKPLNFSLKLTPEQLAILEDFFYNDISSGADPFDYTQPMTDEPLSVRFVEPPAWQEQEATIYSVTISLEIMP